MATSVALLLSGCAGVAASRHAPNAPDGSGLNGTDVSGTVTLPAAALSDTDGSRVDLTSLPADDVTAVFFGYTRCADVCPGTAADLAAARRQLSSQDRDRFHVLFVDVDPAHDTAQVVRSWLDRFDTSFRAALGPRTASDAVLTAVHAPTTVDESDGPSHSGLVYLFAGRRALVYTSGAPGSDYAADVTALLRG